MASEFHVKLPSEEHKLFKQMCDNEGVTVSEKVRDLIRTAIVYSMMTTTQSSGKEIKND